MICGEAQPRAVVACTKKQLAKLIRNMEALAQDYFQYGVL